MHGTTALQTDSKQAKSLHSPGSAHLVPRSVLHLPQTAVGLKQRVFVGQAPLTQGALHNIKVQMFRPDNQLAEEYVLTVKARVCCGACTTCGTACAHAQHKRLFWQTTCLSYACLHVSDQAVANQLQQLTVARLEPVLRSVLLKLQFADAHLQPLPSGG